MADFYNSLMIALMDYNPELCPMSDDARAATDEIRMMFTDHFRTSCDSRGFVFKDGSTWNPIKFQDTRGRQF